MRAEENLTRQGFAVFRPTVNVITSKIGSKSSVTSESLFPRYLFLEVNPDIKYIAPVSSTFGVSKFVKFGDRYAIATENLIAEIKYYMQRQSALVESNVSIKTGDEIYVDGHGFDQVSAIYCNPSGNMRALILMNILGKETKIQVPLTCISKSNTTINVTGKNNAPKIISLSGALI